MGQPAEREYDGLLLEWLQGLMWPCKPQLDENPLDVTLLELFVWFTMVTRKLPPIAIAVGTGHRFYTVSGGQAGSRHLHGHDLTICGESTSVGNRTWPRLFFGNGGGRDLPSGFAGRRKAPVPIVLEWAGQFGWQHVFTPGPPATAYRSRHGLICIVSLYLQEVEVF